MLVDRNELRACMVRKGLIQTQIAKKIERLVSEFGTSFLNLP